MKKQLTTISTFTGIGGFDFGAKLAGFTSILRSDFCPVKGRVFELNKDEDGGKEIPEHFRSEGIMWAGEKGDINNMILPESIDEIKKMIECELGKNHSVDVIMGGPVCHGMSKLNPNNGPDNEKNKLMFVYLEFIRLMQPKVALMEQVPDLLAPKNEWFLDKIQIEIESWGNYYVRYQEMNSIDYGSKQSRKRLIFMLVRKDVGTRPSFPRPIPYDVKDVSVRALFPTVSFFKVHEFGEKLHNSNKPFPTLTAGGQYSFIRGKETTKVTIEEKLKVCDLAGILLGDLSQKDKNILLGNMVQVHFSEAIFKHIRDVILK